MKIAFITTNEERYLNALLEQEHEVFVITNKIDSRVIDFCEEKEICYEVIDNLDFEKREDHDQKILEKLETENADLVILGGYRRLIKNKEFLSKFGRRMINIHNSFLPNFPGAWPHKEAFLTNVRVSGYTIHFVDELMDRGEIILQEEVDISECLNEQEVYDKLVLVGCKGLGKVVEDFANIKLKQI